MIDYIRPRSMPKSDAADIGLLNRQFQDQPTEALLEWAIKLYGDRIVLTCSFGGASGMVLLDMVARQKRQATIVFLDTNLLFPETYALAELASHHYGIPITWHQPVVTLQEQDVREGPELFTHNPDRCCEIRKVTPLAEVLQPYQAWISGIRRDQSERRAATDLIEWSKRYNLLKLNPLAYWDERKVWQYIHTNHVPYNPLLDQGYPSLGCAPCTRMADGTDSRAGRWSGFAKTECGIHV